MYFRFDIAFSCKHLWIKFKNKKFDDRGCDKFKRVPLKLSQLSTVCHWPTFFYNLYGFLDSKLYDIKLYG